MDLIDLFIKRLSFKLDLNRTLLKTFTSTNSSLQFSNFLVLPTETAVKLRPTRPNVTHRFRSTTPDTWAPFQTELSVAWRSSQSAVPEPTNFWRSCQMPANTPPDQASWRWRATKCVRMASWRANLVEQLRVVSSARRCATRWRDYTRSTSRSSTKRWTDEPDDWNSVIVLDDWTWWLNWTTERDDWTVQLNRTTEQNRLIRRLNWISKS